MQDKGFIKVPRGCVFQDILKEPSVFYLYFILLYFARYKAEYIDGVYVKEGQVLISKTLLAEYSKLNVSQVRRILDRFERYGCIKKENVKNKYTLITILPVFSDGKPLTKSGEKRKKNENDNAVNSSRTVNSDTTAKKENEYEHKGQLAAAWNSVTGLPEKEEEAKASGLPVTGDDDTDSDSENMSITDFINSLSKAERLALCGEPYEE